ncbi:hypothetical protein BY996DRAFT_6594795 [Phakopsora pachyrhizi]|nr:hypothetical protein BY996DRAFT_6594795 [Phakopsora pachyrhizi]
MALKCWSLWEGGYPGDGFETLESFGGYNIGQMETDDTDGDAQTSNEITYFSNHSDSESESKSEADTDSNNLGELSSDYQDSLSEISEDMESSPDAILETDIDHEILGEAGD